MRNKPDPYKKGDKLTAKDLNAIVEQVKRSQKLGVTGLAHHNSITGQQIIYHEPIKPVAIVEFATTTAISTYPSITGPCIPDIYPAHKLRFTSFPTTPSLISACTQIDFGDPGAEILVGNLGGTYISQGEIAIAHFYNNRWWVDAGDAGIPMMAATESVDTTINDPIPEVISLTKPHDYQPPEDEPDKEEQQ